MGNELVPPIDSSFFMDRPRQHLKDDDLGRGGFVRSFWKALRSHEANESFVIGIQAPWGDGKTTFKKMVVQLEVDEESLKRLLFIQFNPWEWAGQDQVASAFFRELGSQLNLQSEATRGAERAKAIQSLLLRLSGTLGVLKVISESVTNAVSTINPGVALAAAAATGLLDAGREATEELAGAQKTAAPSEPLSVEKLKYEIRAMFQEYRSATKFNIIVIIDDIDRLAPDEIRQVLQLVKINADFPGLIFVLLYDRSYVERCLKRQFGSDGRHFLEKIVQVELNLPPPPDGVLLKTLVREMKARLSGHSQYRLLLKESRVKSAFDCWLHLHLTNPRKLGRLLTAWSFHFGVFESPAAEINPVDLLILDALLIFEPEVHQQLSRSIAVLFPSSMLSLEKFIESVATHAEGRMESLERIAKKARKDEASVVKMLKILLGVDGNGFSNLNRKEEADRLLDLRFCHPNLFRRYFRLSIDSGDVSQVLVKELNESISKPDEFFKRLDKLEEDGHLLDALDQLLAQPSNPFLDVGLFVGCLVDWWESQLINDAASHRGENDEIQLQNQLLRLYDRSLESEANSRLAIIKNGFSKSSANYSWTKVADHEGWRRDPDSPQLDVDPGDHLTESELSELDELVLRRLSSHFNQSPPNAKPYEIKASLWAVLKYKDHFRIGGDLMKTEHGAVTLLLATVWRMTKTASGSELARMFQPLANMISIKELEIAIRRIKSPLDSFHPDAPEAAQNLFLLAKQIPETQSPASEVASADPGSIT